MKLRERVFFNTKQMIEFVNANDLKPEDVEAIVPQKDEQDGKKTVSITLFYWDRLQGLPPLAEKEVGFDLGKEGELPIREREVHTDYSVQELERINIMYAKEQIATNQMHPSKETLEKYFERKDDERERIDVIRQAAKEYDIELNDAWEEKEG